jgi:hypothetical protein
VYLSELIERLEREDPDLVLPVGWASPHSYRGYYECLAFERRDDVSVADCLAAAREALGSTYQGWKGGDYTMGSYADCYLVMKEGEIGDAMSELLLDLLIAAALRESSETYR